MLIGRFVLNHERGISFGEHSLNISGKKDGSRTDREENIRKKKLKGESIRCTYHRK